MLRDVMSKPAVKCIFVMNMVRCMVLLCVMIFVCVKLSLCDKAGFVFTEYPYKETNKNEMAYREFESACEQTPTCAPLKGLEKVKCVRDCISPTCYYQIYYKDQIEEGEIDVRLNSFKGCFIQKTGRIR